MCVFPVGVRLWKEALPHDNPTNRLPEIYSLYSAILSYTQFYSPVLFLLCVVMHQFVLRMTVSSVSSILLLQDLRSDQSASTVEENTRLEHGSNHHYKGVLSHLTQVRVLFFHNISGSNLK